MGTHCSSELYRGHTLKSKNSTMKLLLLTALAAVAMAEPEAEAGHYGYNRGFYGYGYGHQLTWPGYRAPGFSSTCFGCRGKRSAEAEADAEPGYYGYGHGYFGYPYAFGYRTYGPGIAGHPGAATSFTHRSPQGLRGKRSAEAEPEADAEPGYYGYPAYGYAHYGYGYGLPGRSFAHFGGRVLGKRSAEADAEPGFYGHRYGYGLHRPYYGYRAYGPGIASHPSGTSYTYRSVQGLGK